MKMPIIKNKYEYEIIKNEGEGLKGYGYTLYIYKNDKLDYKIGSFGCEMVAEIRARDYFLQEEFDIDREYDY